MNDSKDAPLTRPDLDALIAEAKKYAGFGQYPGDVLIRQLATALAAERARTDQAEQRIAALQEQGGWSCLHCGHAAEAHSLRGHPSFQCVWEPYWKSAAPTPEHP